MPQTAAPIKSARMTGGFVVTRYSISKVASSPARGDEAHWPLQGMDTR
jgi:hypothetical protein